MNSFYKGSVQFSVRHLSQSDWDGDIIPYQNNTVAYHKPCERINIVNVMLWMKKNAYEETTIKQTAKRLKHLIKNCNTEDPEKVKIYVANKDCSNAYKECLIETYDIYLRSQSQRWDKPFYERYDKKRKAPKEQLVDFIINHARPSMKLKLKMSKNLGTRPIELTWFRVGDFDLTTGITSITGAKHTIGRNGKLKPNTLEMLKQYINRKHLTANDRLFPTVSENISEAYRRLRNRLAEKLQDPTFKTIRLYDYRHFKASMEYHKTKDLLFIKQLLGHKDLRTTLRYTQLLENLGNDEYHCKTAKTINEATQLIENGFEYVTEIDGTKLFKNSFRIFFSRSWILHFGEEQVLVKKP